MLVEEILTVCIDEVEGAGHGPNNHTHHLQSEKEVWKEPPFWFDVLSSPAKAIKPDPTNDELYNDEHDTEFGFVNSFVPADHDFRCPVSQQAREDKAEHSTDEWTGVHVASLFFIKPQRRAKENSCQDDTDKNGPADQGPLNETPPEYGRMKEKGERSKYEFEKVFVRLASVKGHQSRHKLSLP